MVLKTRSISILGSLASNESPTNAQTKTRHSAHLILYSGVSPDSLVCTAPLLIHGCILMAWYELRSRVFECILP